MLPFVKLQLAIFDVAERARMARVGSKERGASAVEYALLIALIAAVIVVAVWMIGNFVASTFHNTCTTIANKGATASGVGVCVSS